MSNILTNEELKKATGYDKNSAIEKCLRAQKIPLLYGKDGQVFTTIDAINSALGIVAGEQQSEEIEFL